MRPKLPLIVMALVIAPTALLSLLAARSLQHRELIVQRRLETAARNAMQAVDAGLRSQVQRSLTLACTALSERLLQGGEIADLEPVARQLRESHPLIGQVYLFMNPWGFIWPESGDAGEVAWGGMERRSERADREADEAPSPGFQDLLLAALQREIASAGASDVPLYFSVDRAPYGFQALGQGRGLYGGYRVNTQELLAELARAVVRIQGGGFAVVARGPGLAESPADRAGGEVTVTDSLGQTTTAAVPARAARAARLLAVERLAPPFTSVTLSAFMHDEFDLQLAGRSSARLYGWGIMLLAGVIVAGAVIELWQAALEVRRARAHGDFIAGVSHDLRTPVASMKMLAESLYLGHVRDEARQKRFLETIMGECERLNHMVERVLLFVRLRQREMAYSPRIVDPVAMVSSVVRSFRVRLSGQEHVTVNLDVQEGIPSVMADEGAMAQVLLNLLDNAVKYSRERENRPSGAQAPGGGRRPSVVQVAVAVVPCPRRRKRHGPWVRISVRDEGMGIEARELERIFRMFYRTAAAKEADASGMGLGLALCRQIVKAHNGTIEVESVVGRGSTFSVFLPSVALPGDRPPVAAGNG